MADKFINRTVMKSFPLMPGMVVKLDDEQKARRHGLVIDKGDHVEIRCKTWFKKGDVIGLIDPIHRSIELNIEPNKKVTSSGSTNSK